jgi:8-oxo-dGTP diphosphatase
MIDCAFENGNKANLRHVTVGVIAVNKNNEVLLVRRSSRIIRGCRYTVPGGFLDRNENTRQAALRELKEETGYIGKILYLFYLNDSPLRPKEDRQNVDIIYVAEVTGGKEKQDKEVSDIQWFSQENLPFEDDFAFDHRGIIGLFFKYQKSPFVLPIIPDL